MKPLSECRLYTFVDTASLGNRSPETVARQLCDGGSDLIQLRAKNLPLNEVRRLALAIKAVTEKAKVGLVINDHPQVAIDVSAPLCHLGQEDFFGAGHTHVSQIVPEGFVVRVGLSTHSPEQARRALSADPAYVAIGPVYRTPTKPGAIPVTLEYVRWATAHVNIPWFVIGGITLDNLDAVLAAGARRICVVSAILQSADIAAACQRFKSRIASVLL